MGNLTEIYGEAFDPNAVDDAATGFDPIPAGWYPVEIENAEIKDTKAGTGKYLAIELTVMGENYAGRKLWPKLNLINPNEVAEQIGQRELAAIGQACLLTAIADTDELLGKQLLARVKITKQEKDAKGNVTREADNEVTAYKPLTENAPAQAPAQARPQQAKQQAPATTTAAAAAKPATKRPWER